MTAVRYGAQVVLCDTGHYNDNEIVMFEFTKVMHYRGDIAERGILRGPVIADGCDCDQNPALRSYRAVHIANKAHCQGFPCAPVGTSQLVQWTWSD